MDYSYQDMVKMQEDAAKRVQDMRRRAKQFVTEENEQPYTDERAAYADIPEIPDKVKVISLPVEPFAQPRKTPESDKHEKNPPFKAADSKLGSLINSDSALILSLCLLLQAEKADEGLIMSLLYLLV